MGAHGGAAFSTYEEFALIYNDFNHRNDYEMWLGRHLLPELGNWGLQTGRVLDVGCGTGRAFGPLLTRGWAITGCDLSPAMLEVARRDFGDRVVLAEADMRELPRFGSFDLALVLNDAVNCLLGDGELEAALDGIRRNLIPGGLLLFDCNSLLVYRTDYEAGEEEERENEGRRWKWTGLGRSEEAASVFRSRIEGDGIDPIVNSERYFPISEVASALTGAGLERLAVLGMHEADGEVMLSEAVDEDRDVKIVYVARAPARSMD